MMKEFWRGNLRSRLLMSMVLNVVMPCAFQFQFLCLKRLVSLCRCATRWLTDILVLRI